MQKAKQAVSDFMSKNGHHDTTVHERVAPAVTDETVKPHKHENITTAIDKEVHQDHYHTSVQPVADRQVLPEQHHHNLVPVEHKEFHHGKGDSDVKTRLAETEAQFKNRQTVASTHETHTAVPVMSGEHIHHHVHETIQPVIQRETIQPHVVHTTVPVHEVHHNAPQHHTTSSLPAVSMDDFKKHGGSLTGRDERHDGFKGEPRAIGGSLTGHNSATAAHDSHHQHHDGHHQHHGGAGTVAGAGAAAAAGAAATRHRRGSNSSISSSDEEKTGLGKHRKHAAEAGAAAAMTKGPGKLGAGAPSAPNSSAPMTTEKKKTGLMAKLDPRVDANGDGQAGFMK